MVAQTDEINANIQTTWQNNTVYSTVVR